MNELKLSITSAIKETDKSMLQRVCDELDYRLDARWVRVGALIEHIRISEFVTQLALVTTV
jgi:hypothetical protein